jgi:dissimilatory sulfite reductase (desulfoviridin) alpha/beta subunit
MNKRNAGRKSKFKEGTQTKIIKRLIPTESENEIKQTIEKILQKWKRN